MYLPIHWISKRVCIVSQLLACRMLKQHIHVYIPLEIEFLGVSISWLMLSFRLELIFSVERCRSKYAAFTVCRCRWWSCHKKQIFILLFIQRKYDNFDFSLTSEFCYLATPKPLPNVNLNRSGFTKNLPYDTLGWVGHKFCFPEALGNFESCRTM